MESESDRGMGSERVGEWRGAREASNRKKWFSLEAEPCFLASF